MSWLIQFWGKFQRISGRNRPNMPQNCATDSSAPAPPPDLPDGDRARRTMIDRPVKSDSPDFRNFLRFPSISFDDFRIFQFACAEIFFGGGDGAKKSDQPRAPSWGTSPGAHFHQRKFRTVHGECSNSGPELREKTRFRENRRKSGLSKSKEIEGKSKEKSKENQRKIEGNITWPLQGDSIFCYEPNLLSLSIWYCC